MQRIEVNSYRDAWDLGQQKYLSFFSSYSSSDFVGFVFVNWVMPNCSQGLLLACGYSWHYSGNCVVLDMKL